MEYNFDYIDNYIKDIIFNIELYIKYNNVNTNIKKLAEIKIIFIKKRIIDYVNKLNKINLNKLSFDLGLEILYYDYYLQENNKYNHRLYSLIIKYISNLQMTINENINKNI